MRTPPPEFAHLKLDAARFRLATANEWHGPCPRCGGRDRFRVHTDKPFPHWRVECRPGAGHCGFSGWADQLEPALRQPIPPEQLARWKAEREDEERAERERLAKRLAKFSDRQLWAELHRRMTAHHRAWWRSQGIDDAAQDYWQLGYTELDKWGGAYSIPYFSPDGKPVNIQYRLATPPDKGDKYRWGGGLGYTSFWTAHCDGASREICYITEGMKKGAVFASRVVMDDQQTYAIPSMSDFAGIEETARNHARRFVILDPGVTSQAIELAERIGGAFVVELPVKLDDAILAGMTHDQLRGYFRQAIKVKPK